MKELKKRAVSIQFAGVLIMTAGLIYEAYSKADIGWLTFSAGTLIFTIGTKLKYYEGKK